MSTTRRAFLDRLALGTAAFGGLSLGLASFPDRLEAAGASTAARGDWDVKWPARLTGKVRTVFDVPEIESGFGVWRASIWAAQYQAVMGMPARDLSTALVLRHNAIVLAMSQAFWDSYGLVAAVKPTHPLTEKPIDRNPALLSSTRGEVPAEADAYALDKFLARGGVALACDLALRHAFVPMIQQKDGVSAEEAHRRAVAGLVPGVIPQPSGIFAVVLAEQSGASYVRAS